MTPSLKKLCIFGLAAGFDEIIIKQINDPSMLKKYYGDLSREEVGTVIWNANLIGATGRAALDQCHAKKDKSKIRQAKRKIEEAVEHYQQVDITKLLSFLFCGLSELNHFCNEKNIIQPVSDAVLNYITLHDPNLEDERTHEAALNAYERWVL